MVSHHQAKESQAWRRIYSRPHPAAPLYEHLEQVIGELRDVSENPIEARIALLHPVNCDPKRIAQVASNLVANALRHGAPQRPIRVLATTNERSFELAVPNEDEAIDPAVMRQLFQPFFRGNGRANQGLGLGLYIASEIARAHDGNIDVPLRKRKPDLRCAFPGREGKSDIAAFHALPEP